MIPWYKYQANTFISSEYFNGARSREENIFVYKKYEKKKKNNKQMKYNSKNVKMK